MTRPQHLRLVGARRGQGTSTVALATASVAAAAGRPTVLVVDDLDDACTLVGVAPPERDRPVPLAECLTLVPHGVELPPVDLVVEDTAGRHLAGGGADPALLVIRGPDYQAVRSALLHPMGACGVVLVREPWRSLTAADVASVLDLPIVAEVAHSPEVARATDAGLFLSRITKMASFRTLRRLAVDGIHPAVLDSMPAS